MFCMVIGPANLKAIMVRRRNFLVHSLLITLTIIFTSLLAELSTSVREVWVSIPNPVKLDTVSPILRLKVLTFFTSFEFARVYMIYRIQIIT